MTRNKTHKAPRPDFSVFPADDNPYAPWVAVVGDNRKTVWSLLCLIGDCGAYADGYLRGESSVISDLSSLGEKFSVPEHHPDVVLLRMAPYAARVLLESLRSQDIAVVVVGEPWSEAGEYTVRPIFTGPDSNSEALALTIKDAVD